MMTEMDLRWYQVVQALWLNPIQPIWGFPTKKKKKKKKLTFGSLIVSQQLVNDNQYWRSLLLLWNWFVVISQGVIFWRKKNLIKLFSIVLNSSKCKKCFLIETKWNLQSQIEIIIDNNQKKKTYSYKLFLCYASTI